MTKMHQQKKESNWEAPVDLFNKTVSTFPVQIFPEWLRNQVLNVTDFAQTPPDAASMAALSVLSTALAKKFEIKASDSGSWVEKINLYTVTSLPSGERKSTIHNILIKPIVDFERKERAAYEPANDLEEPSNKNGSKSLVRLPRYLCDDVTPERVVGLLRENKERIAILSSEGGLFETLNGRYNSDPNIDAFLKGFTGDPIIVERVGRDSETIYEPCITLGLFVQPTMLQGQSERLIERGIFGRFLYALPEPRQTPRDVTPKRLDQQAEQTYFENIQRMMSFDPAQPFTLVLSEEADQEFLKFCSVHEEILYNNLDYIHMNSWAGRLPGQLLKVMALLHVAEQMNSSDGSLDSIDLKISSEIVCNVLNNASYFVEHARKAFGCLRSDGELEDAKYLWNVLNRNPESELKKQDVWKSTKGRLTKAEYLDDALRILVQHGYIDVVVDESSLSRRGRKGSVIIINPKAKQNGTTNRSRGSKEKKSHEPVVDAVNSIPAPAAIMEG
ncbi:YfjI family protein [Paenibacillus validus]|uniref:YfjI family protein n=1 Tax=Paenibacillus validus TaxID=44253 RepID=UPI003D29F680